MKFELIAKLVKFKGTDGKERTSLNFFLETENGTRVRINPFSIETKDGTYSTYPELRVLARKVEE